MGQTYSFDLAAVVSDISTSQRWKNVYSLYIHIALFYLFIASATLLTPDDTKVRLVLVLYRPPLFIYAKAPLYRPPLLYKGHGYFT